MVVYWFSKFFFFFGGGGVRYSFPRLLFSSGFLRSRGFLAVSTSFHSFLTVFVLRGGVWGWCKSTQEAWLKKLGSTRIGEFSMARNSPVGNGGFRV